MGHLYMYNWTGLDCLLTIDRILQCSVAGTLPIVKEPEIDLFSASLCLIRPRSRELRGGGGHTAVYISRRTAD